MVNGVRSILKLKELNWSEKWEKFRDIVKELVYQ